MSESMLVFDVRYSDVSYAIPVARVLHVFEAARITKIPLMPKVVRGIVSHRGRIVTVVDAGVLLNVLSRGTSAAPIESVAPQNVAQVLVLRDGSRDTGHVGLEVGRIHALMKVAELDATVTVIDAETLRAELDGHVSDAIAAQGALR
ncbi:MAG: chemotaxis protein CheW [Clostridia bacterium]|nr:chemotaxis protein CheW [Deltaproteobacteria bacterium]